MEGFIDRLAEFLKSLFGDEGGPTRGRGSESAGTRFRDPDLQDAWEELDDYMRAGAATESEGRTRRQSARPRRPVDESLRQDYANLEVPFGADMDTVRKSYKKLVLKYHPDRHAGNPEKQRAALEITKKINQSFERIRAQHEGGA